jgi:hypothetical protein
LSKWATNQYNNFQFKSKHLDDLVISCPNCKDTLNFTFSEKWKVFSHLNIQTKKSKLTSFDFFDSKEKVTLIVLMTIQLMVLAHDIIFTLTEDMPTKQHYLNWLHLLHFGTVIILLGAGFYNVLDLTFKET